MFASTLNRVMPFVWLATGILVVVTLAETLGKFLVKVGAVTWLQHHGLVLAYTLAGLAALAWLFVFLGVLRRRNKLPRALAKWRWLMDILDRLTNRAELERRLSQEVESIFVDAEALATQRGKARCSTVKASSTRSCRARRCDRSCSRTTASSSGASVVSVERETTMRDPVMPGTQ